MKSERERIEKLIARRGWASFHMRHPNINSIEGFPLHLGQEWGLIHSTCDFHLDGYTLFRLSDIKKIPPRRNFERIIKKEGLPKLAGLDLDVDLSSTQKVLTTFQRTKEIIILDFDYDPNPYLFIGRVIRANMRNVIIWCFDTKGKWDKQPERVNYEDISSIRFRIEYSNVYSKYLSALPTNSETKGT